LNAPRITRFKERLLAACSGLTAVPHGRDILLTFHENMGEALQNLSENSDNDAVHLMHTAKVIRSEIFSRDNTDLQDHLMGRCQNILFLRHCSWRGQAALTLVKI